jgi:hypothetical protein
MLDTTKPSKKQIAPRLVASWPTSFGTIWLAQDARCSCGALVSRHPRETTDGGAELLCASHHVFARVELAAQ